MAHLYQVNERGFASFLAAVDEAKTTGANVVEIATGIVRWTPAPKAKNKIRHVFVNADGTLVLFSKVRR
jgi:hypothetical protein